MGYTELKNKINLKKAKICVIGLGYVGLPLAVEFAKGGFCVTGIDTDADRVNNVLKGVHYILDVPLDEVNKVVRLGRLYPTTKFTELKNADAVIICVPTPLKRRNQPNISYIVSAVKQIAKYLHKDELVVLESTTYPGTTDEVILPLLEKSGLSCGSDFYLAFSPERIDPGNEKYQFKGIPKVVGGITPQATDLVKILYEKVIVKVVPVSSPRVAETVKLLENTFRLINIGLVNELAMMAEKMNIDIWEVIDAAKTKPFGFMPFYPGPGVGGHCLDKNESLFVKDKGLLKVMQMPEFIKYIQTDDKRDVEVLSFDPLRKKSVFRKVIAASARPYSGKMIDIVTQDGRYLKVTDLHPMFIYDGGRMRLKYAKDLLPGDCLPACKDLFDKKNRIRNRVIGKSSDFAEVKVKSVASSSGDWVYSVETEKPHAFVTSFGIAVHNCIPKDPLYLYWKARHHGFTSKFIRLASQINSHMPSYVAHKTEEVLANKNIAIKDAKVLVLGATYKKDVKDLRKSPALEIIDLLLKKADKVAYSDSLIPYLKFDSINLTSEKLNAKTLKKYDCVILATDHSSFDYDLIRKHSLLIFDTRNIYKGIKDEKIVKL